MSISPSAGYRLKNQPVELRIDVHGFAAVLITYQFS
jgi:hypothetical protein